MTTFKREFDFNQNINKTISKNVRKYRMLAGITQEQLAIDIGISPDYIRRFETQEGKEGISMKSVYKISIVLNVSLDKLVNDSTDE